MIFRSKEEIIKSLCLLELKIQCYSSLLFVSPFSLSFVSAFIGRFLVLWLFFLSICDICDFAKVMERSRTKNSSVDKRPKVKSEVNGGNSRTGKTERNDGPRKGAKREPEFEDDDKVKVKTKVKSKTETDDEEEERVVTTIKSKTKVFEDGKRSVAVSSTKKKTVVKERERKSFLLPGQKHEPLEERDGLRVFYESLFRQRPESEMAQIWMMEYGMLDQDEAQQVLDKVRQKKSGLVSYPKSGTPLKPSNGTSSKKSVKSEKGSEKSVKRDSGTKNEKRSSETNGRAKRKLVEEYESSSEEEEVIPQKKRRR